MVTLKVKCEDQQSREGTVSRNHECVQKFSWQSIQLVAIKQRQTNISVFRNTFAEMLSRE